MPAGIHRYAKVQQRVCRASTPHLDQDVQLSSAPVVQWAQVLTDQGAEAVAELQDLVQAVKHLGQTSRSHVTVNP